MFQQSPFLTAHRIDSRAWDFLSLCAADGIDARLVGGCVRDALLTTVDKTNLTDIDIAIAAPPPDVIAFSKKHHVKCIPTGISHGTLTILFKGLILEVTSLRADIDTFGRHATVTFGASFEEDAKRRDFTMNALFVDHQQILYDAFNGVIDLQNGHVRFIGDPATRIAEDYLRLYRYFRFWGRFGKGSADISVLPALDTIKDALSQLSIERVQSELFKILTLPWPGAVLKSMMYYGLLNYVFVDAIDCSTGIKVLRRLTMLERFVGHPPCPIRRLCALTSGYNISDIFRLSRIQKKKFEALSKTLTEPHYEIVLTHPEWWVDSILLKNARSTDPIWTCRLHAKTLTPPPPFPLTGADVMATGITGAQIGEVLTNIKRQWIASGFTLDREACLAYLM
ncbi:MAG: CCA tRNA nucleotidyltransferase [Pseudomonadota bacterium]